MRVYFDENFSHYLVEGLAHIQQGRGSDGIDVCSVVGEFGKGTPDNTWIPGIAARHGVVLTQDTNIHRTNAQWELCQASKVGVFFLVPPKKGWSYWTIVQLVVRWWPEICRMSKSNDRPFACRIDTYSRHPRPLLRTR